MKRLGSRKSRLAVWVGSRPEQKLWAGRRLVSHAGGYRWCPRPWEWLSRRRTVEALLMVGVFKEEWWERTDFGRGKYDATVLQLSVSGPKGRSVWNEWDLPCLLVEGAEWEEIWHFEEASKSRWSQVGQGGSGLHEKRDGHFSITRIKDRKRTRKENGEELWEMLLGRHKKVRSLGADRVHSSGWEISIVLGRLKETEQTLGLEGWGRMCIAVVGKQRGTKEQEYKTVMHGEVSAEAGRWDFAVGLPMSLSQMSLTLQEQHPCPALWYPKTLQTLLLLFLRPGEAEKCVNGGQMESIIKMRVSGSSYGLCYMQGPWRNGMQ